MDRATRRALEAAVDGFAAGREGRHYFDEAGAAIYRLEPAGAECMVMGCLRCHQVTIKPGTPRRSPITVACNGCGRLTLLKPPPDVVWYGRTGVVPVAVG
jgi:hypothetical protein